GASNTAFAHVPDHVPVSLPTDTTRNGSPAMATSAQSMTSHLNVSPGVLDDHFALMQEFLDTHEAVMRGFLGEVKSSRGTSTALPQTFIEPQNLAAPVTVHMSREHVTLASLPETP